MRLMYPRPQDESGSRAWEIRVLSELDRDLYWNTISSLVAAGSNIPTAARTALAQMRIARGYDGRFDYQDFTDLVCKSFLDNAKPEALLSATLSGELTEHNVETELKSTYRIVSSPYEGRRVRKPYVVLIEHETHRPAVFKRFSNQRTPSRFSKPESALTSAKL